MKVLIISETKYEKEKLDKLASQDVIINYTLMPEFPHNYSEELNALNHRLIKKAPAIIFKLEKLYNSSKEAIEYALFLKKQIKIITPDGTVYKDLKLSDWKNSYTDGARTTTERHPVLKQFIEAKSIYFENKNNTKQKELVRLATQDVELNEEEIKQFVTVLARQYHYDVDYRSTTEVYNAYKSLQWFIENDIPYSLDINEVFSVGLIEADHSGYFDASMFDYNQDSAFETEEVESFGDMALLENVIYRGKERHYEV